MGYLGCYDENSLFATQNDLETAWQVGGDAQQANLETAWQKGEGMPASMQKMELAWQEVATYRVHSRACL